MNSIQSVPSHPVDSSLIRSYGFEPNAPADGRGVLALEFRSAVALVQHAPVTVPGRTWWYRNVPESVLEEFLLAESKGRFFRERIRGKFTEIRSEGVAA